MPGLRSYHNAGALINERQLLGGGSDRMCSRNTTLKNSQHGRVGLGCEHSHTQLGQPVCEPSSTGAHLHDWPFVAIDQPLDGLRWIVGAGDVIALREAPEP
jgi:hypothetical protein